MGGFQQALGDRVLRPRIGFLQEANPWAQNAIAERLLEAAHRGMWAEPKPQTLEALRELYLQSETLLEARGETPRGI